MSLVEQYKRDGYVVLPDAVNVQPGDLCASLQNSYDRSPDEFRDIARTLAKQINVLASFLQFPIVDFVKHLGLKFPIMQTQPVIHAMGYDQSFDGTKAHQDYPALQSSLNAVTVWFPVHDVGLDNYPVEVAPGSHLRGLLPSRAGEHYSEVDTTGMGFVPVPVPARSALLFSVFTVHRTRTPGVGRRIAYSHRFEDAGEPTFAKRRYTSAQRRTIDREIKWIPTVEQVRSAIG